MNCQKRITSMRNYMPIKKLFAFSLFLLMSSAMFAQDSVLVRDLETWSGVTLKKSFLDKKLDFALTQEFRFSDNSTYLNNYFTELTAGYEIFKGFEVGLGYRFIRNHRGDNGYRNENRFNTDISYKHKIDRFTLDYRLRYQYRSILKAEDDEDPIQKYRFRLKLKYNIKNWKLDPYISSEVFYAKEVDRVNYVPTITEVNNISGFQKMRFTIGTDFKINKTFEVGGFYRIERDFKTYPLVYYTPGTYHIIGLNLNIKL